VGRFFSKSRGRLQIWASARVCGHRGLRKKIAPLSLLPKLLFSTANDAPPEPLHNPDSYAPKLPLLTELFHFSSNTNRSI
jgi:hypothetical protein